MITFHSSSSPNAGAIAGGVVGGLAALALLGLLARYLHTRNGNSKEPTTLNGAPLAMTQGGKGAYSYDPATGAGFATPSPPPPFYAGGGQQTGGSQMPYVAQQQTPYAAQQQHFGGPSPPVPFGGAPQMHGSGIPYAQPNEMGGAGYQAPAAGWAAGEMYLARTATPGAEAYPARLATPGVEAYPARLATPGVPRMGTPAGERWGWVE